MKKIYNTVIAIFMLMSATAQPISLSYFEKIGGTDRDIAVEFKKDTAGNYYFLGEYTGSVDLNPGGGSNLVASSGKLDVYLVKLDKYGNFAWGKTLGGSSWEYAGDLMVTNSGEVYVTLQTTSPSMYLAGNQITSTAFGRDCIIKYDKDGNSKWGYATEGSTTKPLLALNETGQIYLIMQTYGISDIDFDPTSGTNLIKGKGSTDIGIVKFNSDGVFIWARLIGGTDHDIPSDVVVDNNGDIIICGMYGGTMDADPGNATNLLVSKGDYDGFVCKINSIGNFAWAKSIGTSNYESITKVVADKQRNLYLSVYLNEKTDLDPGAGIVEYDNGLTDHLVLVKLNSSGNYIRSKGYGSSDGKFIGIDLAISTENEIAILARVELTVQFVSGSDTVKIKSMNKFSMVLMTLDSQCNYKYHYHYDPTTDSLLFSSIAYDYQNNLLLSGYFEGAVNVDPHGSEIITSNGNRDAVFLQYNPWPLSVDKTTRLSAIKIFPNPAKEIVNVALGSHYKKGAVTISNNQGQVIYHTSFLNTDLISIPLEMAAGIYTVTLNTDSGKSIARLIKN